MESVETVELQSSDNKIVEFKKEFSKFSTQVAEKVENEALPVEIEEWVLIVMKEFLEIHDYDEKNMKCEKPFVGKNIQDNLDENTLKVLQQYQGLEKVDEMKKLVDAAFYLGFEQFKDACLALIAIEFCAGPSEQDLIDFRKQNDLEEDLTAQEEEEIMKEYKDVFNALNKQFDDELEQEKEKFLKDDEEEVEANNEGQ